MTLTPRVIRQLGTDEHPLGSFTVDELISVGLLPEPPVWETSVHVTCLRSLLLRGLLEEDDEGLHVRGPLAVITDARGSAVCALSVSRLSGSDGVEILLLGDRTAVLERSAPDELGSDFTLASESGAVVGALAVLGACSGVEGKPISTRSIRDADELLRVCQNELPAVTDIATVRAIRAVDGEELHVEEFFVLISADGRWFSLHVTDPRAGTMELNSVDAPTVERVLTRIVRESRRSPKPSAEHAAGSSTA